MRKIRFLAPALVTTVIAFVVYLLTLEPDISWANFGGDGGELITAAVTLGVPHPPGYPTYVLIGKLFSYLPVGTVAYRFNLLSAVCTAISAGFVTAICSMATWGARRRGDEVLVNAEASPRRPAPTVVPAVAAGMAFAFMPLVWGQAIIAEVYGVNLLFVGAFLYFLFRCFIVTAQGGYETRPYSGPAVGEGGHEGRPYNIVLIGLLLGVSMTTHLTSIMLLPLALIVIPFRRWLGLLMGLVIGLLPFLLPPFLAQSGSPVIWGQPDTLEGWWWLVSAQLYRPNVFGLPSSEWPLRLAQWGRLFLEQLAYIGLPLLLVGFFGRLKSHRRLLAGLSAAVLLYTLYAFSYNTFDATVLLLPSLFLLSVILGFALQYLGRAAIILPLALLWLNLSQPEPGYRVNMTTNQAVPVRSAAESLLAVVPDEAILLTAGDPTITALWYFHFVEGKRPDLVVIDGNLFQFKWYREQLGRDYPFLQHLGQDDLPGFIALNREFRPLCETSLVPPGRLQC